MRLRGNLDRAEMHLARRSRWVPGQGFCGGEGDKSCGNGSPDALIPELPATQGRLVMRRAALFFALFARVRLGTKQRMSGAGGPGALLRTLSYQGSADKAKRK